MQLKKNPTKQSITSIGEQIKFESVLRLILILKKKYSSDFLKISGFPIFELLNPLIDYEDSVILGYEYSLFDIVISKEKKSILIEIKNNDKERTKAFVQIYSSLRKQLNMSNEQIKKISTEIKFVAILIELCKANDDFNVSEVFNYRGKAVDIKQIYDLIKEYDIETTSFLFPNKNNETLMHYINEIVNKMVAEKIISNNLIETCKQLVLALARVTILESEGEYDYGDAESITEHLRGIEKSKGASNLVNEFLISRIEKREDEELINHICYSDYSKIILERFKNDTDYFKLFIQCILIMINGDTEINAKDLDTQINALTNLWMSIEQRKRIHFLEKVIENKEGKDV